MKSCTKFRSLVLTGSFASLLAFAASAHAGFVAQSGNDGATVLAFTPGVGNTFAINAGTFSSYNPDTPQDPQLTGGDLARYGYTLNVLGVAPTANPSAFTYTGTYEVFYNTEPGTMAQPFGNDTRDPTDLRVSQGTASLTIELVTVVGGTALEVTAGSLHQLFGPEVPAFADFSYGGSDVGLVGLINIPTASGTSGTANLTFIQVAAVPEPATLAAIAGAATLLRRRRRA